MILSGFSDKKFKKQNTNIKWFDRPIDRFTVLSRVEGLTTLSQVEGQITMTKIQNSTRLSLSQIKQLAFDII